MDWFDKLTPEQRAAEREKLEREIGSHDSFMLEQMEFKNRHRSIQQTIKDTADKYFQPQQPQKSNVKSIADKYFK